MDGPNLQAIREELGMSQLQLAGHLGVSQRTVQACEQGWRGLGSSLERCLLLLLLMYRHGDALMQLHCWDEMHCPPEKREQCFTYVTRQGYMCWFFTGNPCEKKLACEWQEDGHHCERKPHCKWAKKQKECQSCHFFQKLFPQLGHSAATEVAD